jgi:hypothetical protein
VVAAAPARQLTYLEAAPVSDADLKRLLYYLARLDYGDSLLCGDYALERLSIDKSYVEWVLYYRDWVVGVVEVRSADVLAVVLDKLAYVLLAESGWQVADVRPVKNGAITPEHHTFQRVYRLFESFERVKP